MPAVALNMKSNIIETKFLYPSNRNNFILPAVYLNYHRRPAAVVSMKSTIIVTKRLYPGNRGNFNLPPVILITAASGGNYEIYYYRNLLSVSR